MSFRSFPSLADTLFLGSLAAFLIIIGYALTADTSPPAGYTTPARVVEVHDGDTVTVEIVTRVRVRLIDCWAPEVTKDRRVPAAEQAAAKAAGDASRQHLQQLVSRSPDRCILFVPRVGDDIGDSTSMGRVLGHLWLADDLDHSVSERMVAAGHATKVKEPWKARK